MLKLEQIYELALSMQSYIIHTLPHALKKLHEVKAKQDDTKGDVIAGVFRTEDGAIGLILITEKEEYLNELFTEEMRATYTQQKVAAILRNMPQNLMGQG